MSEAIDKVKAENTHLSRQVKHIIDYLTSLDNKVEDHLRSSSESHFQSKASTTLHVRDLSPQRSRSGGRYHFRYQASKDSTDHHSPDLKRNYAVNPILTRADFDPSILTSRVSQDRPVTTSQAEHSLHG